jgi:AcrR family transcriptional regulator
MIPLTGTNGRTIISDMNKGGDTKVTILETGLNLASRLGLEAVTIGALAKATGMSKSGIFAHFQSKENLQIELLKYAGEIFAKDVVVPALRVASGEPRIRAIVVNWIRYGRSLAGGCIFVTASSDFKDRPGKVRDFLLSQQESWIDSLRRVARSAVEAGDFRGDIDCDQFAFELYSLLLGFHLYHTLLDDSETEKRQETALDQLLKSYRQTAAKGKTKGQESGLPA